MTVEADDAIVLVPGLLGFGQFGPRHAPLVRYFDRVVEALERRLPAGLARRCLHHEPPPTGPLVERVESLARAIEHLLTHGFDDGRPAPRRVHLIGHSTGGLDARLLLNEAHALLGGPSAAERRALRARVGAVVALSSPLAGAPFAARASPLLPHVMEGFLRNVLPILFVGSIVLQLNGRSQPRSSHVARWTASVLAAQVSATRGTDALLGMTGRLDAATADQIRRFVQLIVEDHRLFADLEPHAMKELNARVAAHDVHPVHRFATVSPAPTWQLSQLVPRAVYAFLYWMARPEPGARLPEATWVPPAAASLLGPSANDGVVPTASQLTVGPGSNWLVCADHLDVVGHFDDFLEPLIKSGAGFTRSRFEALWAEVAQVMAQ